MIKSKILSKAKNIKHGFFNQLDGKSKGIYKSLNCGFGSYDKKENILNNLKIVAKKINANSKKIVLLNQIHSNKFYFINKKNKFIKNKFKGDAIITDKKNIDPYDVYTADEAFMTGTPFCLLPTVSLQGISIGSGKMGKITESLLNKWSKNVGINIKQQIQNYGKEVNDLNMSAPNPYQFKK